MSIIKSPHKRNKCSSTIDEWLETLGYYRKNVAYDETCLFRAVSEQVYLTQSDHEVVRKSCIQFARDNYDYVSTFYEGKGTLQDYLDNMEIHMVVCGMLEIQIISLRYRHDVIIFDGKNLIMKNVTENDFDKQILLCKIGEDHYDTVYKKEHIVNQGFCQSLVYKTLYTNVFEITNIDEIVIGMLYDKNLNTNIVRHAEFFVYNHEKICKERNNNEEKGQGDSLSDNGEFMANMPIAPFPYKVAKALDPNIYRNIEYDTWIEIRRELRLGDWYYGGEKLTVGVRCLLHNQTETLHCYIQKIGATCVVYVEETAEKRNVAYEQLSPIPHARPWPLPYRFCRSHDRFSLVNAAPEGERNRNRRSSYGNRKQQQQQQQQHRAANDKKCGGASIRNINLNNTNLNNNINNNDENAANAMLPSKQPAVLDSQQEVVNTYEGLPLQMATPVVSINVEEASNVVETVTQELRENLVSIGLESPSGTSKSDQMDNSSSDCSLQSPPLEPAETFPVCNTFCPPVKPSLSPDGSDLPFNNLENLRYFYNLGVDVYNCQNQSPWNVSAIEYTTEYVPDNSYDSYDSSGGQYYASLATPSPGSYAYNDGYSSAMSTPNCTPLNSPHYNYHQSSPIYAAPINSSHIVYNHHAGGGGGVGAQDMPPEYSAQSPIAIYNPYVTPTGFIYPTAAVSSPPIVPYNAALTPQGANVFVYPTTTAIMSNAPPTLTATVTPLSGM